MNKCTVCNGEFKSLIEHIIENHRPLSELNNKGNILCTLCNIGTKYYFKHTFSDLHRFNKDLNSILFFLSVEDFIRHFNQVKNEKEIVEILNFVEENPFWISAKEELDEEQYQQLKEEIIGKQRVSGIRNKRINFRNRNIRHR